MTRSARATIAAAPALLMSLTSIGAQIREGESPFRTSIQPILAKHCFSCHNQKLTFGKLDLEAFHDDRAA